MKIVVFEASRRALSEYIYPGRSIFRLKNLHFFSFSTLKPTLEKHISPVIAQLKGCSPFKTENTLVVMINDLTQSDPKGTARISCG